MLDSVTFESFPILKVFDSITLLYNVIDLIPAMKVNTHPMHTLITEMLFTNRSYLITERVGQM